MEAGWNKQLKKVYKKEIDNSIKKPSNINTTRNEL